MFRKILAAAILVAITAQANTALSNGDVAFTGFNADEDGWVITTFKDIDANTTIYFSDNTRTGSTFDTTESFHTWNTGASSITAGTLILFSQIDAGPRSASIGSFSGSGSNFGISAKSETIYAYLGSSQSAPNTCLTAVSTENDTACLTNAGLSAGFNAVKLTNSTDYAEYIGVRNGLSSFLADQSLVNDTMNQDFDPVHPTYTGY